MQEPQAQPRPTRILVVDDLAASAETLKMLLDLEGFHAEIATHGPEAVALAADFHPDAVLLDLGLPGMDGYEVARALRAEAGPRSMLLVALTGYSDAQTIRRTQEAGFNHHLIKPADMDALIDLLRHATR